VSIIKSGFSAIGRLAAIGLLAFAFLFGLATVVYMSLQGAEVKVPEITGKSFSESEKELASLGLKIKKRADRNSPDPINNVIEQLPKPGETVKTGQLILVVTSKGEGENGDKSTTLKKPSEEDDSEKIEEMIDDKPKKSKSNSNTTKKKADTTRDVTANNSDTNSNSNSNSKSENSNKKESGSNNNSSEKSNKNTQPSDKKDKTTSGGKPTGETRPKPLTRPRSVQP
jgi:hypothetical protein